MALSITYLRRVVTGALALFVLFLIARFGGLSYFPWLRYFSLLILLLPLIRGFPVRWEVSLKEYFFTCLSIYLLYSGLFLSYLQVDSHYSEFLVFYFENRMNLPGSSLASVSLFESIQFACILSGVGFFMNRSIRN